jgi:hypothetical protein
MACRPGPLRAGRSLRDVYVPSVGAMENPHADQRRPKAKPITSHEVTAAPGSPQTGLRLWGGNAQGSRAEAPASNFASAA